MLIGSEGNDVFQLGGFEDASSAIDTATRIRAEQGIRTGYTEPATFLTIVVTAAITSVVGEVIRRSIEAAVGREARRRASEERDRTIAAVERNEALQSAMLEQLEQMRTILEAATRDDVEVHERTRTAVEQLLDEAGVEEVSLAPENDSERLLAMEMERMTSGRLRAVDKLFPPPEQ